MQALNHSLAVHSRVLARSDPEPQEGDTMSDVGKNAGLRSVRSWEVLGLLLVLLLFGGGTLAHAQATFVVDRTDDDATATACTAAPNDCSLRGAIIAANALAGSDAITLPAQRGCSGHR